MNADNASREWSFFDPRSSAFIGGQIVFSSASYSTLVSV
jgi:hypothetical protein